MSLEKQWKLIRLLLERSKSGLAEWKRGVDENTLQVSVKDYTVLLRQTLNEFEEGTYDYEIRIMNEHGEIVDAFNDNDLTQEFSTSPRNQQERPYGVINELYMLARRSAFGSDKILDEIIEELEDIPF